MDGLLDVHVRIGEWSGACTLLVQPLDNIDCILGMDFFVSNKVTLTPHLGGVLIDEGKYCVQAGFDCDKEWPVRFQELTIPKERDLAMIETLGATIDHLLKIPK